MNMISKETIELINELEKRRWEYRIINGTFEMELGNQAIIFKIDEKEQPINTLKQILLY